MFKYFLNLDNEATYQNQYEIHKKNCPIAKQLAGAEQFMELGFFENGSEALVAAKELLAERGLDPTKANGCLACSKECHQR